MLIRIYNRRTPQNKAMIDELINIDGLPESFFFKPVSGEFIFDEPNEDGTLKKQFRKGTGIQEPWEADVPENIHPSILEKYGIKKEYYVKIDKQLLGPYILQAVRMDYGLTAGEEMWKKIENILEREIPRDRVVPVPLAVGTKNEWLLKVSEVPNVDLRKPEPERVKEEVNPVAEVKQEAPVSESVSTVEKRRPGRPKKLVEA